MAGRIMRVISVLIKQSHLLRRVGSYWYKSQERDLAVDDYGDHRTSGIALAHNRRVVGFPKIDRVSPLLHAAKYKSLAIRRETVVAACRGVFRRNHRFVDHLSCRRLMK